MKRRIRKERIKDEAIKRPGDIKTVFTGKKNPCKTVVEVIPLVRNLRRVYPAKWGFNCL
jgi:hypothetical protein